MNNLEIITEFGTFVLIGGVATAHVILPFAGFLDCWNARSYQKNLKKN
ncbi:hypothetical protein J4214_03365 [Candidatus Woesearchaeota archaeon]|nr:hypothetical protein [Candidatus Woesearchaeota archaeon]